MPQSVSQSALADFTDVTEDFTDVSDDPDDSDDHDDHDDPYDHYAHVYTTACGNILILLVAQYFDNFCDLMLH